MSGKKGRIIIVRLDGTDLPAILGSRDHWDFVGRIGEGVRVEFISKVRALVPVKVTKPRKAKSASIAPLHEQPTPNSGTSTNVQGDWNKVAGRDFHETHFHEGAKPRIELARRGDEITAAQERKIQNKIAKWASVIVAASKGKKTREDAFGEVQTRFKNRFQIPKYSALRAEDFDEAMAYIRMEIAKLTPKLLRADKKAGRNKLMGSIKQAMADMRTSNAEYYPQLARRLKIQPFASLTKLGDRALKAVYRMARADARQKTGH
jgi:hypothetical protein